MYKGSRLEDVSSSLNVDDCTLDDILKHKNHQNRLTASTCSTDMNQSETSPFFFGGGGVQ